MTGDTDSRLATVNSRSPLRGGTTPGARSHRGRTAGCPERNGCRLDCDNREAWRRSYSRMAIECATPHGDVCSQSAMVSGIVET